jgi:hypothetical protein
MIHKKSKHNLPHISLFFSVARVFRGLGSLETSSLIYTCCQLIKAFYGTVRYLPYRTVPVQYLDHAVWYSTVGTVPYRTELYRTTVQVILTAFNGILCEFLLYTYKRKSSHRSTLIYACFALSYTIHILCLPLQVTNYIN